MMLAQRLERYRWGMRAGEATVASRATLWVGHEEAAEAVRDALQAAYSDAHAPCYDSDADRQQEAVRDALEALAAALGLEVK